MAKLNRDEELYSKLKDILQKYRIDYSSEGTLADILYGKIYDYSDLEDKAFNLLYDVNGNEKSVNSEIISNLYQLKEEAYERRISEVRQKLSEVGLEKFQYDDDLEKQRARKTDHKTRYSKVSSEVYYNELIRQLSDLPYGSERVRRKTLEGLFVKVPAALEQLREQFTNLTGQEYQVPKTTFKREFVTLREKIGKQLAEEAGISEKIAGLDQHYQYRFLTDRWNNTLEKNKGNTPVLSDFADKQLQNLRSDVAVLDSYQTLVVKLKENGIIASDSGITPLKHLSVRDKIKVYRQQLGSVLKRNLDQIVNLVGSHSPAYLDLVESQKRDNPTLYEKTVKELSKDLNFSDTRTDNFVNRKVPLSSWQKIVDDVRARRSAEKERLFNGDLTSQSEFSEAWKNKGWVRRLVNYREVQKRDGTTVKIPDGVIKFKDSYYRNGIDDGALASAREQEKSHLLGISFDDFNRAYQSSGEVRSLFPRTEVTDTNNNPVTSNGKLVTKPEGLTRFNGFWYRDSVDEEKLEKDFSTFIGDSEEKISAAKQKIISAKESRIQQLQKDIEDRDKKNLDTSKQKELLNKLTERLDAFNSKDYSYDNVGSLDKRAAIIKAAADELTVKANILEQDPAFNFNRILRDVKREDRIGTLGDANEFLKANVRDVEVYRQRYQDSNLSAPSWVTGKPVHDQLLWYCNAGALMSDISGKDREEFSSWISEQEYGTLVKQLPVGYLRKINGQVFRSVEDADIISQFDQDFLRFKEREDRIMTGPAKQESSSVTTNEFGKWLQNRQTTTQNDMEPVKAAAESKDFSSSYKALTEQQKQLFDYNYGKPVEAGGNFYRTVYDIPDKVWKEQERAAGFAVPRQRGSVAPVTDFDVKKEEELQKKISEDLRNRSWEEPVKKTVRSSLEESAVISEQQLMKQAERDALSEMMAVAKAQARTVKIGGMGMLASFALFNAAISGPSEEVIAHRRKVEEERRRKMYGYL